MLITSDFGKLHSVASFQRAAFVVSSCLVAATPWIWVWINPVIDCAAMNTAKIVTQLTRRNADTSFFPVSPGAASVLYAMNAATNTLKMAPTSAASITQTPTARPASASRIQEMLWKSPTTAASARKHEASAVAGTAMPQHAVEKNSEFNAAAMPPRMHAAGASLSRRKKYPALQPRNRKTSGTYSFANPIGFRIQSSTPVIGNRKLPV